MNKRQKYLSWDGYFMGIAFLSSLRSKDPNTRNGACIVDSENKAIGNGYNGFPTGCSDEEFPWNRDGVDNKYLYVIHAEVNAILNSGGATKNCKMYLYSEKGYYPCNECAKIIIQSGIKEVIMSHAIGFDTDKYAIKPTLKMFNASEVKVKILDGSWKEDVGFIYNEISFLKNTNK